MILNYESVLFYQDPRFIRCISIDGSCCYWRESLGD
jgi:hypothetical protein